MSHVALFIFILARELECHAVRAVTVEANVAAWLAKQQKLGGVYPRAKRWRIGGRRHPEQA